MRTKWKAASVRFFFFFFMEKVSQKSTIVLMERGFCFSILKVSLDCRLGIVWLDQAGTTQASIFTVEGALFACSLNGTMDTIFQTALLLPKLRALLRREYRNGIYPFDCNRQP